MSALRLLRTPANGSAPQRLVACRAGEGAARGRFGGCLATRYRDGWFAGAIAPVDAARLIRVADLAPAETSSRGRAITGRSLDVVRAERTELRRNGEQALCRATALPGRPRWEACLHPAIACDIVTRAGRCAAHG